MLVNNKGIKEISIDYLTEWIDRFRYPIEAIELFDNRVKFDGEEVRSISLWKEYIQWMIVPLIVDLHPYLRVNELFIVV
jgi:hypothetical protein